MDRPRGATTARATTRETRALVRRAIGLSALAGVALAVMGASARATTRVLNARLREVASGGTEADGARALGAGRVRSVREHALGRMGRPEGVMGDVGGGGRDETTTSKADARRENADARDDGDDAFASEVDAYDAGDVDDADDDAVVVDEAEAWGAMLRRGGATER
ncbi:unnamed product [Ostreococcus tauri]|uniref:Unnamed product n=1 Tax=Ostreococcus tauri TaxID=70448 RepID=A0A090M2S3_OSTTA|nr:unnamed product [Ostreococcus tauri]CEF98501.1 unnamed product [Ostreococcus tauri]|eukprot:XP_022839299.1 unnamed product [Ostreococcus tauri]